MKRKNIYIKTAIVTLLVTVGSVGCKKITNINESPNNPALEKATPQVLFPSAVLSTAGRVGGELAIIGNIWSQFYAQNNVSSQYRDIDSYNLQRQDRNGSYNELFAGALSDYQLTITQAKAQGLNNYLLFATLMKAYTYQVLVDLYDKVPYTEALQGESNKQPKFDDGYAIYTSLLAEIDAALAASASADDLITEEKKIDFVFNGEIAKWRLFANTLKLKMYLRMVNAKPAEAEAGIKKLYADGAEFLTEDAGIIDIYTDAPDLGNPMYEYNIRRLNTTTNLKASKTFVTWLADNNDGRKLAYFNTATPVGIEQGDFNSTATTAFTNAYQQSTDPVLFFSAAESYFMQAEARLRYFNGAGAEDLFDTGVEAAFAQYDLAAPAKTGVYKYPTAGNLQDKLKAIIIQKWASLPGSHALEAFFEQERTGYPETTTKYTTDPGYIGGQWVYSKGGVTGGRLPKRLVYPDSERSKNPNTPAEVPITTPVWWGLPNL
ncbi:MAG TPA: SusD/RagB family nutrient-binding outer membrane lipoprotein [Pedobacter sp.]|uniref:SusD/RagB family nutrient-binding outer membrane lipoprotein n=1 Tax=Pedobacter sp. TaxID=1411316 RepID=UPI002B93E805|nr:SusD/RagB family nutrient-binding outer membrane lipoprotein [Pedobacter sp.]HMI02520.1 SusD/RagB family nutrient-binding outer membrane lipoprotein [Pedobacter sp.]